MTEYEHWVSTTNRALGIHLRYLTRLYLPSIFYSSEFTFPSSTTELYVAVLFSEAAERDEPKLMQLFHFDFI